MDKKQKDEKDLAAHSNIEFYHKKYTIMKDQYKKLEDNINDYTINLKNIDFVIEEGKKS